MDRQAALEEQIAHLTKTVDELSEIVARQQKDLDLMRTRMGMLMEAEALRQSDGEGSVPLADQRPPHW